MSFTGESGSVTSSGDRMFPFVLPHDRPHPHWNNFPSPASSVNKLSLSSKQLHFQFKPINICGKLLMKWIQFQRWFVSSPPKVQTFEYSGPFILYNRYEIPSDRTCTEPCTVPPLKAKHPTGGASNPRSSFCISLQHASRSMLSLLCGCCVGVSRDKLWMQRKSCKICCIFYYLHVKGHKSSSVKSAIKKWQVLLSGFFIGYYLQWQQLLLHHCTAYHIICS